ncbi:DUF4913 domain-containing protein [Nocardia brasiliensis]|uniref:DUF4913 domain-containing protein n=1 Tax=Nocardia brasiliensis TaxID=37326 RepID=UPI00379BD6A9
MTAATPPGGTPKPPTAPSFVHFTDFADKWLLPFVNVRLAEANREQTYTWCRNWWEHRSVAVRVAHLHSAFEAQRRSRSATSLSTYLLSHIDPHMRWILDAANGPLHRCTRTAHVSTPSLPFDPVPDGWFGPAPTPPIAGSAGDKPNKPPVFGHYRDFVQDWLLPVTSVRVAANNREGQYSWCRQWWRHRGVAIRFASIHRVFEAAVRAEDPSAMSTLFVRHIDPHLRDVLDAAKGPLHRCTPEHHVDCPGLPSAPIPTAWFGAHGAKTRPHRLGFGPDFRALGQGLPAAGDS